MIPPKGSFGKKVVVDGVVVDPPQINTEYMMLWKNGRTRGFAYPSESLLRENGFVPLETVTEQIEEVPTPATKYEYFDDKIVKTVYVPIEIEDEFDDPESEVEIDELDK